MEKLLKFLLGRVIGISLGFLYILLGIIQIFSLGIIYFSDIPDSGKVYQGIMKNLCEE